jgi:hypothetical protein
MDYFFLSVYILALAKGHAWPDDRDVEGKMSWGLEWN